MAQEPMAWTRAPSLRLHEHACTVYKSQVGLPHEATFRRLLSQPGPTADGRFCQLHLLRAYPKTDSNCNPQRTRGLVLGSALSPQCTRGLVLGSAVSFETTPTAVARAADLRGVCAAKSIAPYHTLSRVVFAT